MKSIVVSGASSGIGKTTLANEIVALLGNDSLAVKIGHGEFKPGKNEYYFHSGTSLTTILQAAPEKKYLIIESNSVLNEFQPDLVLYIDGKNRKVSAETASRKAHIKSGSMIGVELVNELSLKLDMPVAVLRKIIWLAGARPEQVQGVMLAGGKSSRMGTDKALLHIGNETMAERIASVLNPLSDSIVVSLHKNKISPLDGYPVVYDHEPDKGPLMGIYSALDYTTCNRCVITPCDVPYVNPVLLRKMLSVSDDYDIVVPSFRNGHVESLVGVYKKECCSIIKNQLDNNILRISEVFKLCRTQIIDTEDGSWYVNLNTPDEYNAYCKGLMQ